MRVGIGYDSHRFSDEAPLVLGGVRVPDHPGLLGHSDGDAVAHAVIDAVLGAAGEGNVGAHFPPTDPRWRGSDSIGLLSRVGELLAQRGWTVVNVDVVVVCESPKVGPLAPRMHQRLGGALGVSPSMISVKGKSNEGLGWIGAGEGLAVHAIALVTR